ncbi:MAG TPA: hypothetical protein VGC41_16045 [Kofleriaceae bacterium]
MWFSPTEMATRSNAPAPFQNNDFAKREMSTELRRARNWILAVGIIMFVVDTLMIQVVQGNQLPDVWKRNLFILDCGVLAYFVGMFFLAKNQPKLACILALLGFWGLQIGVAVFTGDPTTLVKSGILIKIMFTAALIQGLKSANRAELLKGQLETVFE